MTDDRTTSLWLESTPDIGSGVTPPAHVDVAVIGGGNTAVEEALIIANAEDYMGFYTEQYENN